MADAAPTETIEIADPTEAKLAEEQAANEQAATDTDKQQQQPKDSTDKKDKKDKKNKNNEDDIIYQFKRDEQKLYHHNPVANDFDVYEWDEIGTKEDWVREEEEKLQSRHNQSRRGLQHQDDDDEEEDQPAGDDDENEEKQQQQQDEDNEKKKDEKKQQKRGDDDDEEGKQEAARRAEQMRTIDVEKKIMEKKFKIEIKSEIKDVLDKYKKDYDRIRKVIAQQGKYLVVTQKGNSTLTFFYIMPEVFLQSKLKTELKYFHIKYKLDLVDAKADDLYDVFMSPIGTHILICLEMSSNAANISNKGMAAAIPDAISSGPQAMTLYLNTTIMEKKLRDHVQTLNEQLQKNSKATIKVKDIPLEAKVAVNDDTRVYLENQLYAQFITSVAWDPKYYKISTQRWDYMQVLKELEPSNRRNISNEAVRALEDLRKSFEQTRWLLLGTEAGTVAACKCNTKAPKANPSDAAAAKKKKNQCKDMFNVRKCLFEQLNVLDAGEASKASSSMMEKKVIPVSGLEIARKDGKTIVATTTFLSVLVFVSTENFDKKIEFDKIFAPYRPSSSDDAASSSEQKPLHILLTDVSKVKMKDLLLDSDPNAIRSEYHLLRNTEVSGDDEDEEDEEEDDDDGRDGARGGAPSSQKDPPGMSDPTAYAWVTGEGIVHGDFYADQPDKTITIANCSLLKIAEEQIRSVTISDYHVYILYQDKLHIVMQPPELKGAKESQNTLLSSVIFSYPASEMSGAIRGMCKDHHMKDNTQEILVYTTNEVYYVERNASNQMKEKYGIWKTYLEQAINLDVQELRVEYYSKASQLCDDKHDKYNVKSALGDYLYSSGNLKRAAIAYSQTQRHFEEIVAKLIEKDPEDTKSGLQTYLTRMLNKLPSWSIDSEAEADRDPYRVQRFCICSWLLQLYIQKINYHTNNINKRYNIYCRPEKRSAQEKEKREAIADRKAARHALRQFLLKYRSIFSREAAMKRMCYNMLESNGCMSDSLLFAALIGDYERVIRQLLVKQQFDDAYHILKEYCVDLSKKQEHEVLWYKYSPLLMINARPELRSKMLQDFEQWSDLLTPDRLVPALLQFLDALHRPQVHPLAQEKLTKTVQGSMRRAATKYQMAGRMDRGTQLFNTQSSMFQNLSQQINETDVQQTDAKITWSNAILHDKHAGRDVIAYLKSSIDRKIANTSVHNMLVYLLSMLPNAEKQTLYEFLNPDNRLSGEVTYTPEFALRCSLEPRGEHTKYHSAVLLYSSMKLYEQAIDVALTFDEEKEEVQDREWKKRLFLKIVQHLVKQAFANTAATTNATDSAAISTTPTVINAEPLKRALKYMQEFDDLIRLRDVLSMFPNQTILKDYLSEIQSALSLYNSETEQLRAQAIESTNDSAMIREELNMMHMERDLLENEPCDYCRDPILRRDEDDFVVFPCDHMFHLACLKQLVIHNLNDLAKYYTHILPKEQQSKSLSALILLYDQDDGSNNVAAAAAGNTTLTALQQAAKSAQDCLEQTKVIEDQFDEVMKLKAELKKMKEMGYTAAALDAKVRKQEQRLLDLIAFACPLDGIAEEPSKKKQQVAAATQQQVQQDKGIAVAATNIDLIKLPLLDKEEESLW